MPFINVQPRGRQEGYATGAINGAVWKVPLNRDINVTQRVADGLTAQGYTFTTATSSPDTTIYDIGARNTSDTAVKVPGDQLEPGKVGKKRRRYLAAHYPSGGTPTPTPGGNILPTAAISDVALLQGTGSPYPNPGSITLPAGDWVLSMGVKLPASNSYDQALILLTPGVSGTTYLNNPHLLLAFMPSTSSNSVDPARGSLILSGKDDAGNWLSPHANRSISSYWGGYGTNTRYLAGPYMQTPDGIPQVIFIQKVGGVVQLWTVAPGQAPILHDYAPTSFGLFTSTENSLLRINGPFARANSVAIQRLFACAGSLTADQMAAIAQGVDPRQYLAFNQPTDRLTSFQNTGTAAQPDIVGSGSITLSGTGNHTVTTPIIPTTVLAEMPRVLLENDQVVQRSGSISDLPLTGTVTGVDDDIYAQIVDFTTKTTIVKPFTKVATSVNGKWSGSLTGIQTALQWYDIQLRKGLNGPVYTLNRRFGLGIVMDWWGQSIAEKMRSTTVTTISGTAAGFLSFFSRAKSDSGSTQGTQQRGWKRTNSQGYGEVHASRLIAEAAQCPVGGIMSAMEGSAINAWGRGNTSAYVPAADSWLRTRPGYMIWSQGQGSTGTNPATYTAFLDTLLQQTREDFPWSWKFIMEPLNNNGATANNAGAFDAIRKAQSDWADANAGPRLSHAGGFVDLKLNDTVHPGPEAAGQGRIAERIARQVLWMEGVAPTSARGPRITSAVRSGAVIDLTVAHNGGTALQVPYAGDITGFRASTSSTFGALLTISSAVVLDATTIRLTLSADPGAPVYVDYQWGNPGATTTPLDSNGFIPAVSNPVYDNRSPGMNTALGFPVQFTTASLVTPS